MIFNDTNLAVLRVLAAAAEPLTVRDITAHLPAYGWVPGPRNHPTSTHPRPSAVSNTLKALEWNEGTRRPLVTKVGSVGRAATWAITEEGRQVIEAEDAPLPAPEIEVPEHPEVNRD